ncbi:MAG: hypothetical protein K2N91_06510 [Muribaculaceae bacterium]|nr:hypothetical protein [Muribaculaceae bacterium]
METKTCPYCGGEIMIVAKKCKHCGKWLDESYNSADHEIETTPQSYEAVENETPQSETNNKFFLIAGVLGIILIIIIICSGLNKKSNQVSEVPGDYIEDQVYPVEEVVAIDEEVIAIDPVYDIQETGDNYYRTQEYESASSYSSYEEDVDYSEGMIE